MICECGHVKEQHLTIEQWTLSEPLCCAINVTIDGQHTDICRCGGYKADNLKFLEQKYEESLK